MDKQTGLSLVQWGLAIFISYHLVQPAFGHPHNWTALILANAIGFTAMYAKRDR